MRIQRAAQIQQSAALDAAPAPSDAKAKRFAIAFSFAGEQNDYVERVWTALRRYGGLPRRSIFYHKRFEGELSRIDLDTYLQVIYGKQSELLVVFLSADYAKKESTGLEWRVMRDIIKRKDAALVMPIRFDGTEIAGLFSIDGYVSAIGRAGGRRRDPRSPRIEPGVRGGLTPDHGRRWRYSDDDSLGARLRNWFAPASFVIRIAAPS